MNEYYVYILSNDSNTLLYIGVTNDLARRVSEHGAGINDGFTKEYNIHKLVYYETATDMDGAILREKQLKRWSRIKKERLINFMNPRWLDLNVRE